MEIKDSLNTYAVVPAKPAEQKQQRRKGEQRPQPPAQEPPEPSAHSADPKPHEGPSPHLDEYA